MDPKLAASLLQSLCDRLEPSEDRRRFGLKGPVSRQEFEALGAAISMLDDALSTAPAPTPPAVTSLPKVELDLRSLEADLPDDLIACIDFGTAFSKAGVRRLKEDEFLDLPLGELAGESELVYPVSSSLFFENDQILFGAQAVAQSRFTGQSRLDSIKRYLSERVDIVRERPISGEINRTPFAFTYRDGVLLYLGYLTDLLGQAFAAAGLPRFVKRRYTLPGIESRDSGAAREVENLMQRLLAEAQVLADTFEGRWAFGLSAAEAYAACRQVAELPQAPIALVDIGLPEAVAASQSAVDRTSNRAIMLVVDIGAGTTDIGAFIVQPGAETAAVAPLANSLKVLRRAGDRIDEALIDLALRKSGATPRSHTYDIVQTDLQIRVRELKQEVLASYGAAVNVYLANDQVVTLSAAELELHEWVQEFVRDLRAEMAGALVGLESQDLDALNGRCRVVLTGGGSRLPSVKEVCSSVLDLGERKISLTMVDTRPEWLDDMAPAFGQVFDQMAVAAGGCEPPEAMARVIQVVRSFGGGVVPKRVVTTTYKA